MSLGLQRGVRSCLAEEDGRRPSLGVTGGDAQWAVSTAAFFSPSQTPSSWHAEAFSRRQGEVSQQLKVGGFEELEGKGVKKREKRRKEKAVLMFPPLNPKPCWVIRTATDQEPQVKLGGEGGPPNPYPYGLDHERPSTGGSRPKNASQVCLQRVTKSETVFNANNAEKVVHLQCKELLIYKHLPNAYKIRLERFLYR